jgi:catechol 2,3-dioxygenase-like lactoylglutathione lyase family enzyme
VTESASAAVPRPTTAPAIAGLDHVQLAMPAGSEATARAYYGQLLGLREIDKPTSLAGRGGTWFSLPDGRQLHLGVDGSFSPQTKAHPALRAVDLDGLARRLEAAGHTVTWDVALAPRRRFYVADPFGNRLEFVAD